MLLKIKLNNNGWKNKLYKKKENLFSFTTLNKYYLLPFISPVFCAGNSIFLKIIIDKIKNLENKQELQLILYYYRNNICDIIVGLFILLIFLKKMNKEIKLNHLK